MVTRPAWVSKGGHIGFFQALAWGAWRSDKAVRKFSGENAAELWQEAMAGRYPKGLGRPIVPPPLIFEKLKAAMQSGALRWKAGPYSSPTQH